MTTFEKVKRILSEDFAVGEITLETSLLDDLGMDSLDQVEAIMACEEEFGFEISDEEADSLITVGDIVKLIIDKKLA